MTDGTNSSVAAPTITTELSTFRDQLTDVLGDELISLILYGPNLSPDRSQGRAPVNVLIVTRDVNTTILDLLSPLVRKATSEFGLAVMLLGRHDVQSSTDAFPVKFLNIRQNHVLLAGENVVEDLMIRSEDLRLRCEQEIRNALLRLRSAYLYRVIEPKQLQAALTNTFSSSLLPLNAFLSLVDGQMRGSDRAVVEDVAKLLKLAVEPFHRLLEIRRSTAELEATDLKSLVENVMEMLSRAAEVIDRFQVKD